MTTNPDKEQEKQDQVDKITIDRLSIDMIKAMTKDYVASELSYKKIATKYNVAPSTVQRLSKNQKWVYKRKKFIERVVEKAVNDTQERFQRIAGDVSEVFFKQAKYIKRRLALVPDGEPVPEELMQQAVRLHELVQRDLMKLRELNKNHVTGSIKVESSLPSVVDLIAYKPKNTKPPGELIVDKPDVEVEVQDKDEEKTKAILADIPPDPLGDN